MKAAQSQREYKHRTQKIEVSLYKVLKAIAECYDMSVDFLIETIILHAIADEKVFDATAHLRIEQIQRIYKMDYDVWSTRT